MKVIIWAIILVTLLAGCVPATPVPIEIPPVITQFDATPSSIAPGNVSTLKWKVNGADRVSIDQGIGDVAVNGQQMVFPTASTTYTLTAVNQFGSSTVRVQIVVVDTNATRPAAPTTQYPIVAVFAANPANIAMGGESVISWDVKNSFDVSIEPNFGPIKPSGSKTVTPPYTTTYKLTANNNFGSILATTTVTVSATPPTVDTPVIKFFTANPCVIKKGESSTLSWSSINGSSATIDQHVGIVGGEGTTQVSPATTTTYTLLVTNPEGAQYQTVTVNVK